MLLDALDELLVVCGECGFRVHTKKSHCFLREVRFCGRIISEWTVKHDPQKLSALLEMKPPSAADELQKLLYPATCMPNTIPAYLKLPSSMQMSLEKAF